jgi:hypothetical protein
MQREGIMKFKNLSLVFVFVFFASLMVFCLCRQAEDVKPDRSYTFEWHIPASIQDRYPDLIFKTDLEKKFTGLMTNVSGNHQMNAHGQNGTLLASYHAVFYTDKGTISGPGRINKHFSDNAGHSFVVEEEVEVTCFDMERPGAEGDDAIDFVIVVRFDHSFGNSGQGQDPPGEVIYFHRKICTSDN